MENPQTAVVLHFRDGRTMREESAPSIDLDRRNVTAGELNVPFDELKAVFFRREKAPEGEPPLANGSVVSVEFADGEVLRGMTHDYNPIASGFYITPLDEMKLQRVFVVSSAVIAIEVEKL
ncbi:MAG: hypothetical protein HYU52_08440 [Acidobacteria bacterium]|nr:hypothetical protein [Acidobacteriota bacterium]